jgi:hypothetical protein
VGGLAGGGGAGAVGCFSPSLIAEKVPERSNGAVSNALAAVPGRAIEFGSKFGSRCSPYVAGGDRRGCLIWGPQRVSPEVALDPDLGNGMVVAS